MPSATKSWHHSIARPPDEARPALRGVFETESRRQACGCLSCHWWEAARVFWGCELV